MPTAALIALPLVGLAPQTARDVWIWLSLALLLVTFGILLKILRHLEQPGISPKLEPLLFGFGLLFPAVAANFHVDQTIILFFCLFTLSLFGLIKHKPWLAGVALGLAFGLKTTGIALWFLFLAQRRWRALAWGISSVVVIILVTWPWIGLNTWWAYLQAAARVTNSPTKTVTAYQTTAGFFAHLFRFDRSGIRFLLFIGLFWPRG